MFRSKILRFIRYGILTMLVVSLSGIILMTKRTDFKRKSLPKDIPELILGENLFRKTVAKEPVYPPANIPKATPQRSLDQGALNMFMMDQQGENERNPAAQTISGSTLNKTRCIKQVHIWGNEERPKGTEPCPGLPCDINLVIDTNYETLKTSDAVLLLHRTNWNWSDLMSRRPEGQKWIFQSHESAANTRRNIVPSKENYNYSYDYIMSYRHRESNLYGRFGYYDCSKPSVSSNDTTNWAKGRTRQVAWISSNCKSGYLKWNRLGFVREMAKLLDVGMYGSCGDAKACPGRSVNGPMTCTHVIREFKFYLALENSACRDYISEKFWYNSLLQDVVPIVFGPPRSDYEAVAPPNSFIHVEDFETLQDLTDYVNLLDKNDTLYNRYFEWKKEGSVVATFEDWLFAPRQMCQVVRRMLYDERGAKAGTIQRSVLPDWESWWTASCRNLDINGFPIKIHK